VTAAERSRLSAITGVSENHTLGDWSGDCIGFAVLGWDRAGSAVPLRNARVVFDQYNRAGRVRTDRNPPRGALVFWNASQGGTNFGHVEISLGNGRTIGTQGWDGQRLPVSIDTITAANYLGWVMP
jgi:cell wall-associated NlpC family hydrolase